MRYFKPETVYAGARLPSGKPVIVEIYDMGTGVLEPLDDDVCTELAPATGLYVWSSANFTTQPTTSTQFVYTMIDQIDNNRFDGKIIVGDTVVADLVWKALLSSYTTLGEAGDKLGKLLERNFWFGSK